MRTFKSLAGLAAILAIGGAGCTEQPVAPEAALDPPVSVTAPGHDLSLELPDLSVGQPDSGTGIVGATRQPPVGASAAAPPGVPDDYDLDFSVITEAESIPYAANGNAGNRARTTFTGNVIRVDVWSSVSFLGETVVNNLLQTSQNTYMLPKIAKEFDAYSNTPITGACGHTASGNAQHKTWIEYAMITWGATERPSNSSPHSQPGCTITEEEGEDPGGSGGTGGGGKDGGEEDGMYICWYRIWTDSNGRIVLTEFLGCA